MAEHQNAPVERIVRWFSRAKDVVPDTRPAVGTSQARAPRAEYLALVEQASRRAGC